MKQYQANHDFFRLDDQVIKHLHVSRHEKKTLNKDCRDLTPALTVLLWFRIKNRWQGIKDKGGNKSRGFLYSNPASIYWYWSRVVSQICVLCPATLVFCKSPTEKLSLFFIMFWDNTNQNGVAILLGDMTKFQHNFGCLEWWTKINRVESWI